MNLINWPAWSSCWVCLPCGWSNNRNGPKCSSAPRAIRDIAWPRRVRTERSNFRVDRRDGGSLVVLLDIAVWPQRWRPKVKDPTAAQGLLATIAAATWTATRTRSGPRMKRFLSTLFRVVWTGIRTRGWLRTKRCDTDGYGGDFPGRQPRRLRSTALLAWRRGELHRREASEADPIVLDRADASVIVPAEGPVTWWFWVIRHQPTELPCRLERRQVLQPTTALGHGRPLRRASLCALGVQPWTKPWQQPQPLQLELVPTWRQPNCPIAAAPDPWLRLWRDQPRRRARDGTRPGYPSSITRVTPTASPPNGAPFLPATLLSLSISLFLPKPHQDYYNVRKFALKPENPDNDVKEKKKDVKRKIVSGET